MYHWLLARHTEFVGNDKNNLTVDWSHYHANTTMGKECWSWASRCLWGVKKYNSPTNACVYVLSAWFRLFYKFILTLELTRISRNYQSSSEICLDLQRWYLLCSASEGRIIILWLTDCLIECCLASGKTAVSTFENSFFLFVIRLFVKMESLHLRW